MVIVLHHVSKSMKSSALTFDTEKKIYCREMCRHDVYMYAGHNNDIHLVMFQLVLYDFEEVDEKTFYERVWKEAV